MYKEIKKTTATARLTARIGAVLVLKTMNLVMNSAAAMVAKIHSTV